MPGMCSREGIFRGLGTELLSIYRINYNDRRQEFEADRMGNYRVW